MTDFEIKMMNDMTIDTVSKAIVDETSKWGFKNADYLSLVNALLESSLNKPRTDVSEIITNENHALEKLKLPLSGEQIKIRLYNKATDYEVVNSWLEDELGRMFLLSRLNNEDTTLDKITKDERNLLGLITLEDSTPIGLMGFLDYDSKQNKAEMRKMIGSEEYREKGFAKEATMLWIKYGLNNLGLKKIYLYTIENNIRNVTLNKELGFQIEGILRKECLIDDEHYDLLRMGLIVDW